MVTIETRWATAATPRNKGGIQKSVAFDQKDDHLESVSVKDCGFMTLRGAFAKPQDSISSISFGPEPGLSISVNDGVKVNGDTVYGLLSGPSEDRSSGVHANPGEVVFGGLALWLSLREPGLYGLSAEGQLANRGIVPCFAAYRGGHEGYGTTVYWGMRDFVYLSALLGRILLRNNRTVLRLSNYLCEVMDQGPRLPSVLSSRPELGMLLGVRPVMGFA